MTNSALSPHPIDLAAALWVGAIVITSVVVLCLWVSRLASRRKVSEAARRDRNIVRMSMARRDRKQSREQDVVR